MRLFFVIDTSGSMAGAKIGALNDAMINILSELQYEGVPMEVSVLLYSKTVRWMYERPIDISEFEWKNVEANGMTAMGKACIALAKRFTEDEASNDVSIIIIISDGYPTDDFDEGINALNETPSFLSSNRFAIAVDDADEVALQRFTGNSDRVFKLKDINNLTGDIFNIISDTIPKQRHTVSREKESDDEWD